MPARHLLPALLALLALACDDDPPPRPPSEPPGEVPSSISSGAARDTLEMRDGAPEAGEVVLHPGDDAPPTPLPLHGTPGSCDARPTAPLCFAFSGTGWTTAAAQAECAEAEGGVYQSAACPAEERIGECVYRPDGDAAREIVYTFYAPMDVLIAEGICRGSFRAF